MDLKAMQEEWLKNNKVTIVKSNAKANEASRKSYAKRVSTKEGRAEVNKRSSQNYYKLVSTSEGRKTMRANSNRSNHKARATEVGRHATRMATMKSSFDLTEEDFQSLMDLQQGCCAICGKDFGELNTRAHVDHSHETGVIRKLLCGECNWRVGHIENSDSSKVLEYLNTAKTSIPYTARQATLYKSAYKNPTCSICRSTENIFVDHDHKSGFIRGLLCAKCNTYMSTYDSDILSAVKEYIAS